MSSPDHSFSAEGAALTRDVEDRMTRALRLSVEQSGNLDYTALPLKPAIDKDAETALIKDDAYSYALSELDDFLSRTANGLAERFGERVVPADCFPEAATILEADRFALAGELAPALWFDRIDWDQAMISRIGALINRAGLSRHADLFGEATETCARAAEEIAAKVSSRVAMTEAMKHYEQDRGWLRRWAEADEGAKLSRACADMAIAHAMPVHFSHIPLIVDAAVTRLAMHPRGSHA